MIREDRNWVEYRNLPNNFEVDFHWPTRRPPEKDYWSCMGEVYEEALEALKRAYAEGYQFVIFRHGASTSRPGQTTARSVVRGLMRSKESTPYIVKSRSIQHPTVFVATIRKRKEAYKPCQQEES